MVAPAMDMDMFEHPALQENLNRLRSFGNLIIEPATGALASGLSGKGRMEEPEKLLEIIADFFAVKKKI
jgi:phosphopantothenoylcysteine decarboxylase/phosphopantothenate--cysteine ligase